MTGRGRRRTRQAVTNPEPDLSNNPQDLSLPHLANQITEHGRLLEGLQNVPQLLNGLLARLNNNPPAVAPAAVAVPAPAAVVVPAPAVVAATAPPVVAAPAPPVVAAQAPAAVVVPDVTTPAPAAVAASAADGIVAAASDVDDDFDQVMDNLSENPNPSDQDEDGEEDPEILAVITAEAKTDHGPKIDDTLASGFQSAVSKPTEKSLLDAVKGRLKLPENCSYLAVPKVNSAIWSGLSREARVNDVKYQGAQQIMSLVLGNLAKLSDEIKRAKKLPKEHRKLLLELAMDSARAFGSAFHEMSMKRRSQLRPHLNPDYAELCSSRNPVTDELFGSNLGEQMKESKSLSDLTKKASVSKQRRHIPYTKSNPARTEFRRNKTNNTNNGGHLNPHRPSRRRSNNDDQVDGQSSKNTKYYHDKRRRH